jgi:aminopeptidase N
MIRRTNHILLFLIVMLAGVALADGRKFDPADGRDPRQYPPDPQVDYLHVKLDLRMADPMSKSFECVETITFKTLGLPIAELKLDAVNLQIRSVTDLQGRQIEYSADDKRLIARFAPPLAPHTESGLTISYACSDPKDGMIFALPDDGYLDRPLMVHTQGQTETNRHWFISHDYPNERFTSEIITTVPAK